MQQQIDQGCSDEPSLFYEHQVFDKIPQWKDIHRFYAPIVVLRIYIFFEFSLKIIAFIFLLIIIRLLIILCSSWWLWTLDYFSYIVLVSINLLCPYGIRIDTNTYVHRYIHDNVFLHSVNLFNLMLQRWIQHICVYCVIE